MHLFNIAKNFWQYENFDFYFKMKSAESKAVVTIKQQEQNLIKKLKQVCDENGREIDP